MICRTKALLAIASLAMAAVADAATLDFSQSWEFSRDDQQHWNKVNLPHVARIEAAIPTHAWQGTAYYKKAFDVRLKPGERAILRFEAAMNVADVWLNGQHLGQHLGGYLPFAFDVTKFLSRGGKNELLVRINNEDNAITGPKPLKLLDYIQYGGLYRGAALIVKPAVHITDEMLSGTPAGGGVFVTYPQADKTAAQVQVKTEVCNTAQEARTVTLRNELRRGGRSVAQAEEPSSLAAGECRHITQNLHVDRPALWAPRSPDLYLLQTSVASKSQRDSVQTRIGIRRLAMENGKLLLNGEALLLRGVNRHQEYPYVGYAMSDQAGYRDALLIKKAGFDYVRLSHYPQSPAFMAAADELGLMLLPGIPGWQFYNPDPAFGAQVVKTCADMIRRDRNHPSVLAWECSLNETPMPESLADTLHRTVRQEYPGDQAYSAGWLPGVYDIYLQARQHKLGKNTPPPPANKPLIVSEYGDWEYFAMNAGFNQTAWADMLPKDRNSRPLLGDGETRLLQQARNIAEAHDDNFTTGAVADGYWVMFDYGRGCCEDLSSSGAYSIDRLPKFAAHFFRSQRSVEEDGAMVFVASYWQPGSSPTVRVFSNADEVELSLNGRVVQRKKGGPSATHPHLAHAPIEFELPRFEPGELRAVAFVDGKPAATHIVRTPGEAVKLQLQLDDMGIAPVRDDLVFVRARVLDAQGTVVPVSGRKVKFAAAAGYEIVGPDEVESAAGIASVLVRVRDAKRRGNSVSAVSGSLAGRL